MSFGFFSFDGAPTATQFHPVRLDGTGFVTGLSVAADGTRFCRTDVGGAYRWNGSQWVQLITRDSFPDWAYGGFTGCYEIVPAPSLSSTLYMYYSDGFSFGYVYKSTDSGQTWARAGNFPNTIASANNGNARFFNHRIAVDPANPSIVFAATPSGGVYKTSNGGITWTLVTAVGDGGAVGDGSVGSNVISFDPTTTSGGSTPGVWIGTYGTGFYHSTDGGVSWTLKNSTGMPTTFISMLVDQFGFVWVVDFSPGNLHQWNGSAWASKNGSASGLGTVAVDPASSTQLTSNVFVNDATGNLYVSTNGGTSFVGPTGFSVASTAVPWIQFANDSFLSLGQIVFDPTLSNVLLASCGIGVASTTPPHSSTSVAWNFDLTIGIEELVVNEIISPPGGHVLLSAWDRPVWDISTPDAVASRYYPNNSNIIVPGWSLDYSKSDPTTIGAILAGSAATTAGGDISGLLGSGGTTYTQFATKPSVSLLTGGSICTATDLSLLWVPSNDGGVFYSTDGGATWHAAPTGQSGTGGWNHAYPNRMRPACADEVDGSFTIYNNGQGSAGADKGFYSSTDGGVSWSKVNTNALGAQSNFGCKLKAVPGNAGHRFFTPGPLDSTGNAGQPFYKSTDHGATWNAISNVLEVLSFGFGKAASGGYPTIFIVGWLSGVLGVYRSIDAGVTWTALSIGLPLSRFDNVTDVCGDANVFGTVYIGFAGTGAIYGKIQ